MAWEAFVVHGALAASEEECPAVEWECETWTHRQCLQVARITRQFPELVQIPSLTIQAVIPDIEGVVDRSVVVVDSVGEAALVVAAKVEMITVDTIEDM